jgi:hypothetical protein
MRVWKKSLLALSVSGLLTLSASAYAAGGALKIQIHDLNGNPIAGATVKVNSPEVLGAKEAVSDENGIVRLVGLSPSRKYIVSVASDGYEAVESENVIIVSDKTFNLDYGLVSADDVETISVTGSRTYTQIDTTSPTVGMDITLDLTESLPTGRSYQSYLQLAPGTKPSADGNPSSKSGVNYSDIGGDMGSSSDNVYYLDGIDTTDGNSGGYGSNINSEIIQEQRVLTGGIPAKYAGGTGLVSIVKTKSGGNEFSGSINYYFQNDSLVADNKHTDGRQFSTYDAAVTLGGPIIKDQLWFYASYQKKSETTDVFNSTGDFMRSVDDDSDLGFIKLTWQATDNDNFEFSYFNDPRDLSGSDSATTTNNRDLSASYGGDNYKLSYTHSWDDFILTAKIARHESENSLNAADPAIRNNVAYYGYDATEAELSKGGYGTNSEEFRNRTEYHLDGIYYLDTDIGLHTIEMGVGRIDNELKQNETYSGDMQYTSIAAMNAGVTFGEYNLSDGWEGSKSVSDADYTRIIDAMATSGDSSYYEDLLDANSDGSISTDELSALAFNSTSGNPTDDVNSYRIVMTSTAPVKMETKGTTAYLQDTFTIGDQYTIVAGVRAEKWEHYSSEGEKIATFDWEFAPRLSAIWDINGDGSSKVWGFYGRYYDPIRTNMTDFAGNVTGPVREEQVYVGDRWLTFRTRGGVGGQDAYIAPTTKTPYTDEFMLGYSRTLNEEYAVELTYTERRTRNILEDYDLGLYSDELEGTDFYLPLSYFGYSELPDSNYVIGTLKGAKRDYKGVELSLRRNRIDNWQAYASFTYNDAQGNSNSDSNADYQGDVVWLDPRSPNMYGDQPGNIKYLFKLFGTYYFDNGVELGAVYTWNSGYQYSETYLLGSRHMPLRDTAYEYGGTTQPWTKAGTVGSHEADSYGTLDVRVKYTQEFEYFKAEYFLDIFNVLDDQAGTTVTDLVDGDGDYAFGEANDWVQPRRLYLGARLTF